MKAALLTGIRQFEIKQVPGPIIKNDTDVLIRIKTIGICGSDIHYYTTGRIGTQIIQFPFIIGHEAAGIVESIGKKVTKVKPDQRIAIDPTVFCGKCDQCLSGRENTCRELLFLGCPKQLEGALCEYIVLPENCCFPIKNSMTFEQATLSEPLAIALYSVEKSFLPKKANVAILGLGPVGMSVFNVLRSKKINDIYVTDKIEERLLFSKKMKPRWAGNPCHTDIIKEISEIEPLLLDVVYECSGDKEAINQAIYLLKPGGILVIIGISEDDDISFPMHELRRREITVINIRRQAHFTQKAIDLLYRNIINLDSLVTHHFPLEQIQQAFDLAAHYKDGVMKIIINID